MNSSSTTTGRSGSTSSGSRPLAAAAADAYPEEEEEAKEGRILETPDLRIFTFAELRAATRNFKPDTVLGEGGFGRVYKGWIDEKTMNPTRSGIGMGVAVKKLNPESVQGLQEWQVRLVRMNTPPRLSKLLLLFYCHQLATLVAADRDDVDSVVRAGFTNRSLLLFRFGLAQCAGDRRAGTIDP